MNEFHDHASDHRMSQFKKFEYRRLLIRAGKISARKSHTCFRFLTYDKVENMALHFPDTYDQELRQNPNKFSRLQGIEAGAENLLRGKPFPRHQPLSRFSDDVTAAMLVYRTIVKEVFWKFDVIIMQNVSDILPLFCTPTWPSHHVSETQL